MSVVNLNAESVIASVVTAMLPRFSDHKLGLLIEVDMGLTDFGYGADGNTEEREPLSVRRYLNFLFVRPSNYTKVLFWEAPEGSKGLDISPYYSKGILEWNMECDHDSCWRSDGLRQITKAYFDSRRKFEGRTITGKPLNINDLSEYTSFHREPMYMRLETFEQKDKNAKIFSEESRVFNVKMVSTGLSELEARESKEPSVSGGLLIKGSEDYKVYTDPNYSLVTSGVL